MTNKDLTLLAVLADKSGSMHICKDDSEGGLNNLIEEQRALPGKLELAVAEFDTIYHISRDLGLLTKAYHYTLRPGGGTALLDAMGRYISEIGEQLAARPESKRPGKVIMLVVTDGQENSSREWTYTQVQELVERQKNNYQWEFIFLGANMDAVSEGSKIGVGAASSLTYNANDGVAIQNAYSATSSNITNSRLTGASVNYSEADRTQSMGGVSK